MFRRVRTTDPHLQRVVDDALARSATFRGLVDTLEASDLIIYISPQMPARDNVIGELHFGVTKGSERYIRICIQRDLHRPLLASTIAHELQHAIEVAETPTVVDTASMRAMYRVRGFPVTSHSFETNAAQDIARRVLTEVTAPQPQR